MNSTKARPKKTICRSRRLPVHSYDTKRTGGKLGESGVAASLPQIYRNVPAGTFMRLSVPPRNGHCVYLHRVGGTVIYVGKGSVSRAFAFDFSRNEVWLQATKDAALVEVEILHWCASEQEALDLGRQMILELQPIANLTFTKATRSRRLEFAHRGYDEEAVQRRSGLFRGLLSKSLKQRSKRSRRKR